MPTPHLLLHLPEKGKQFESTPQLIEAYRALAGERGYAWVGSPGRPLDPAVRAELERAIQQGEEVYLYLFVRLSLEARQLALYRGRLLVLTEPGPNEDSEHVLPGLRRKSCGVWFKVEGLEPAEPGQLDRLCLPTTGQAAPIWTDLRSEVCLVVPGNPPAALPEYHSHPWLLCLNKPRARSEFEQSWRFQPLAAFQPGTAEFTTECNAGTPQLVLAYDHVFGSSTYLRILGLYRVSELIPQGTAAGAMAYALQLQEVTVFPDHVRLDPRPGPGLWGQLDIARQTEDWGAFLVGSRVLLPLPEEDYRRILALAGLPADLQSALQPQESRTLPLPAETDQATRVGDIDLAAALEKLEEMAVRPIQEITEVECYHLLRVLEQAMRAFIDRQLSRVSRDWWNEGRLPAENRIRAEERKQKRERPFPWMVQPDLPAKEYMDFSDYAEIITMECNWRDVFQTIFLYPEVIRGKLIELHMFRNDIAHMRTLPAGDKGVFIAYVRQLLLTICRC